MFILIGMNVYFNWHECLIGMNVYFNWHECLVGNNVYFNWHECLIGMNIYDKGQIPDIQSKIFKSLVRRWGDCQGGWLGQKHVPSF